MKDNNEKQIEEMAKELSPYGFCKTTICENCNRRKTSKCRYYSFAKRYTIKGYRKQSDTVREFVERAKEIYDKGFYSHGSYDIFDLWSDIIHLAAEEYGAEVEEC